MVDVRVPKWWKYTVLVVVAIAVCLLLARATQATSPSLKPIVSIRRNYYQITGSTATQLRQQMNQLGPVWSSGKRFDAITRWHVRWSYRYAVQNNRCQLTTSRVHVDITITMPQWTPPPQAATSLIKQWRRYSTALQTHEYGHRDHGLAAARDAAYALQVFPGYPNCQYLDLAINTRMMQIIEQYGEKDREYDQRTQHGATQGARFP
jgi:predicted secreted Zn-dependent protease